MPVFEYRCPANGCVVEVTHDSGVVLRNWGEVCYLASTEPGDTDPAAMVEKVITRAPGVVVTDSDSELREQGFTKLVKRDEGVYENVTASGDEERFMIRGKKESMPHIHKKIRD